MQLIETIIAIFEVGCSVTGTDTLIISNFFNQFLQTIIVRGSNVNYLSSMFSLFFESPSQGEASYVLANKYYDDHSSWPYVTAVYLTFNVKVVSCDICW